MAAEKNYARLGMFVAISLLVIIATGIFFVQRMKARAVIPLVTYTEGNVSGLAVSSPVKYRGVEIGRVSNLRVEPRGSLIEIDFDLYVDRLGDLGANVERVKGQAATGTFDRFRTQVVSNPVTGDAYLLVDMPQQLPPAITLAFTPKRAYIPAMPTMMERMEDRLPALLDRAVTTLQTLEELIAKMPDSLERTNRFVATAERVLNESHLPEVSTDSRKFFQTSTTEMARMSTNIERITASLDDALGPDGTLSQFVEDTNRLIAAADLEGTTKATRDAMNQSSLAADDLRRSLPAMRDALSQLRDLARLLEEQPESMVYGPRPAKVKK
jgi:ABC-type transporter Mla subunit MlaD